MPTDNAVDHAQKPIALDPLRAPADRAVTLEYAGRSHHPRSKFAFFLCGGWTILAVLEALYYSWMFYQAGMDSLDRNAFRIAFFCRLAGGIGLGLGIGGIVLELRHPVRQRRLRPFLICGIANTLAFLTPLLWQFRIHGA